MRNNESIKNNISSSIINRGAYSTFATILNVYNKTCKISYNDKNNKKAIHDNVDIRLIYFGTTQWIPKVGEIVIIENINSHITITQPLSVKDTSKKKLRSQPTLTNTIGGVLF